MAKAMTPMMQQYLDLKEKYSDAILFFRLGDFYEMFFEDAKLASKELGITLTGRECGQAERAPMCGVPHHAMDGYLNKLVIKGYKVAICEQVEDPKEAKGIVRRDVTRIVTPGTNLNMQALEATKNNYLMCIYNQIAEYGIAYVDITTGDFYTTKVRGIQNLLDEIARIQPAEIIYNQSFESNYEALESIQKRFHSFMSVKEDWLFEEKHSVEVIKRHFKAATLEGLGLSEQPLATSASGALLDYLLDTQKGSVTNITNIHYYFTGDYMLLDRSTRRNLEIVETLREKDHVGSLLWVLDRTKTAMGARLLRTFALQPLIDVVRIHERLDAIEELTNQQMLREELREFLTPVYDLERLMSKISCGTANSRDLLAFKQSIGMLPVIKEAISECHSSLLQSIYSGMDELIDLFDLIDRAILEEPPISIREGGFIRDGYDEEVDKLRNATNNGKQWLAALEVKERELTGIKGLKINYNKIFGFYIEITNSYKNMVPEDRFTRKQTLANCERFITPELKEMENTILGAEEKVTAIEYELFIALRNELSSHVERVKKSAEYLSLIDVIQSLADVAVKQGFSRPQLTNEDTIHIVEGRHPVVEKMMDHGQFITNDTLLDSKENRFSIITGPNMAGKSTYMRQVALIVLMAQIGSFVPAKSAEIGIVDRIFTRVGASDDLASGQSTFMVEMTEVANILRNATAKSLLILDEIGRGTSTFDGLSIAWAVVEHIANPFIMGAKTLFATHYHELTELEGKIDGVVNYCISVKENGDDIIFLRKIIKAGADKSYGIQVAKLAGVPQMVIERAKEILEELSEADIAQHSKKIVPKKMENKENNKIMESFQINLFDPYESEIIKSIRAIDVNKLTPIDALLLLSKLKDQVENK